MGRNHNLCRSTTQKNYLYLKKNFFYTNSLQKFKQYRTAIKKNQFFHPQEKIF